MAAAVAAAAANRRRPSLRGAVVWGGAVPLDSREAERLLDAFRAGGRTATDRALGVGNSSRYQWACAWRGEVLWSRRRRLARRGALEPAPAPRSGTWRSSVRRRWHGTRGSSR